MTPQQTQLLHVAIRQTVPPLNDRQYRMVLQNVAGVATSTKLTNAQFEEVMAVLEARGFRQRGQSETYWRDKAAAQGSRTNERQIHLIHELAAQQPYALGALVRKFSHSRTDQPAQLTPQEAWQLTEMLKKVADRSSTGVSPVSHEAEADEGLLGQRTETGTCTAVAPAQAAAKTQESLFDCTPAGSCCPPIIEPAARRTRPPRAGFSRGTGYQPVSSNPIDQELHRPMEDCEVPF